MSPKIATARRQGPFEDLGMFRAVLTLAGFNANCLDAKSTVPETLTQSRPTS